jgi:hypothetical protein
MREFRITARPNGHTLAPGAYELRVELARGVAPKTGIVVTARGTVRRSPAAEQHTPRCEAVAGVAISSFTQLASSLAPSPPAPPAATPPPGVAATPSAETAPRFFPDPIGALRGHGGGSTMGWLLLGLIAFAIAAPLAALVRRRLAR